MKRIFLFALVLAAACHSPETKTGTTKGDSSSPASTADDNGDSKGDLTFKANGEQINSGVWVISGFHFAGQPRGLNITSDMHKDKHGINVNLNGYGPGDYVLTNDKVSVPHSYGIYFPDYADNSNSYMLNSGHVTITVFDTVKNVLNATFSGTATNEKGEKIEITDGVITNGKISPEQKMPE